MDVPIPNRDLADFQNEQNAHALVRIWRDTSDRIDRLEDDNLKAILRYLLGPKPAGIG
jgi:hypothetical protein